MHSPGLRPSFSRVLPLLFLLTAWFAGVTHGVEVGVAAADIEADSYELQAATGMAVARGNVHASYQDVRVSADYAEYNTKTTDIVASGNVVLQRGVFVWRGQTVQGNLTQRDFTVGPYEAQAGPWYCVGAGGRHHADGAASSRDVRLSTCEYVDRPHYCLKARRVHYYPDGKFRAYHTWYSIGRVPILYLPVVFGDTNVDMGGIEIKPGYSSDWGGYLLLGKEWRVGKRSSTKMLLDLRSKNGVAVGNETQLLTDSSQTDILLYGMDDHDPPETEPGYNRRFDVRDERFRGRLYHRQELSDNTTLRLRLDALSDIDMLEDWFRRDHRRSPQPKSYADLAYESERFALSLTARPRLNDFYSVVERLPEARLDLPRQALGDSGLYYQGHAAAAQLKMRWREFDKPRPPGLEDPADYETWRFDTLHMLYAPMKLRDLVQVVPRAGLRLTHYGDSSNQPLTFDDLVNLIDVDDPDNPDDSTDIVNYDEQGRARTRIAGELGLELSAKFYRTWQSTQSRRWQVDGLRHVVQPYANYTYSPSPSEERENLFFFDTIDRLNEQHFVRTGVRQRWQTKRSDAIYTLASMDTYADFHFTKKDRRHSLGDLGTILELRPSDRLRLWGLAVADMGEPDLNRAEVGTEFGDPRRFVVGVSYAYVNRYASQRTYSMGSFLPDYAWGQPLERFYDRSHSLTLRLEFPITPKTSGRISYEYDLVEGEVARQTYEITRDLHCWVGSLALDEENGDIRVLLLLYLKAFPKFDIDVSL